MTTIVKVYMKLHIRNITKDDFMEYRCVARNSLGDSDGSITLYGQLEENISNFAWINLLCRGVPTNTFNDNCGDNHRTRDNHPEETEDERFD